MRGVAVKNKAILLISIIVLSTLYFPINTKIVYAQSPGCCEETIDGETCIDTTQNECKPEKFRNSPCIDASYCSSILQGASLGCCFFPYSLDSCFSRSAQQECENKGGLFLDNKDCKNTIECSWGCCVLGSQADLKTETQCGILSQTNNFELDFRPEILDPFECANIANSQTEGCCVINNIYTYVTLAECQGEFHESKFCSDLPDSPCTPTEKTSCFDSNVWKLDSCGNKDKNIRDENKPQEICDYNKGKICKELGVYNAICEDVNCNSTYSDNRNSHDPELGSFRENGESWCIYEGPTGNYLDRPGSRHFRFSCLNGEEIVDECRNFREEVCIQSNPESSTENPLGGASIDNIINFGQNLPLDALNQLSGYFNTLAPLLDSPLKLKPGFNSAKCELNDIYDKPLTQEQTTVPLGFAFWEFEGTTSLNTLISSAGIPDQFGISTRLQEQRAQIPREDLPRTESSRDGSEICAQASLPPIKVKWEVGPICKNDCIQNCFAEKQDFIDKNAELCSSLGDCGIKYNIEGKLSPQGSILSNLGSTTINTVIGTTLGSITGSVAGPIGSSASSISVGSLSSVFGGGYPPSFIVNWQGNAPGTKPTQVSPQLLLLWKTQNGVHKGMKQLSLLISDIKKQIITQMGGTGSGSGGFFASPLRKIGVTGLGLGAAGFALGKLVTPVIFVSPLFVIIGIVVLVTLVIIGDCDYPTKTVTISCNPWEPPPGGEDCDKCNSFSGTDLKDINEVLANNCNEYKCKSLGKSCQFILTNDGGTCIDGNPNDISPPKIYPHKEILDTQSLDYLETQSGYTIKNQVQAFNTLILAIKTNEHATCFYQDHVTSSIEEMITQFGSTLPSLDHTLEITNPPSNPQSPTETTYYIRCKDNYNNPSIQYSIKFTVEKAQDLTAPLIKEIKVENKLIKFQQKEAEVTLLVSDSSNVNCKYSKTSSKRYDQLEENMYCTDIKTDSVNYQCTALLQDLIQGENTFYFICQDSNNFESQESKLTLLGSSQLSVVSIEPTPSGTINNNEITIAVATLGGAEDGKAICSYSINGKFIDEMKNTDATRHTQFQQLSNGEYRYDISCKDAAGNQAKTTIQFKVSLTEESQQINPRLIQAYKENELFIILNKKTTCEYDAQQFFYGDGALMSEPDSTVHSAPLGFSKYYIRCKDHFGKDVAPIELVP